LSLEYFEGPAGSGKTYNLIEGLKTFLAGQPLLEDQAVLGITYMHGSRRRMHATLGRFTPIGGRFHACTVDSLIRSVVLRWRTLSRELEPALNLMTVPDFDTTCRVGALLLQKEIVGRWFAKRYPIVLADELQDCRGDRLGVIKAISGWCHLIAAADGFQDLESTGVNEAVEWLHGAGGKGTKLTGNHRTKDTNLLTAAKQLRGSGDCGEILGYGCLPARNPDAGAGGVARAVTYKKATGKDVVILTPTGPRASTFVRDVVERLVAKPIQPKGVKQPVGPFRIEWEVSGDAEKVELLARLGDVSAGIELCELMRRCSADRDAGQDLREWARGRYCLKGITRFSATDLDEAVSRILQSRRAFLPDKHISFIRAMTINQAKNREFEGVVVLWPFQVKGDIESLRRKLYNAITRAKKWVCVVVQEAPNPKESRVAKPPFSKPMKAKG
jgi:UvrD-like helicase C-terminal domain